MITVINAGGSGSRLWPLSTPDYPKHLLRLNGGQESLLQATYTRLKDISKQVYVVTDASHGHHVREQLPELPDESFIVEPARRGTASCVAAGLAAIAKKHGEDVPVAFVAADHYVRNKIGFSHSFYVAQNVAAEHKRIVLVGAEPDHPATGFGYIEKGDLVSKDTYVFKVGEFKEKPDHALAQKYLKSGNYLWNCGYFVGTPATFLERMQQHAPNLYANYQKLLGAKDAEAYEKAYLEFENDAIDYVLIERVKDLLVVPASFDWLDLGSYQDLYKAVESDEQGNHIHGTQVELDDVQNSFIQNHDERPLAVIGLDNVVVVSTKDGMLVARKDISQRVGDVSKRFGKQ